PADQFGQWIGAVQVEPPPRIRSWKPCLTWPVATPCWVTTQFHGGGDDHSEFGDGQTLPVLIVYWGEQPAPISPGRLEVLGSQSTEFWLRVPLPARRSWTAGSEACDWTTSDPSVARVTVSWWLVPAWNEFAPAELPAPASPICSCWIGPERTGSATKP